MPPNVKENVAVVDSLATLSVKDLIHPKFAVLAGPQKDLFSAAHIEANLVADSKRLQARGYESEEANDDYWAEAHCDENEAETSVALQQSTQGHVEAKKQLIDQILREEEIRQMFKIEHIEAATVRDPARHLSWDVGVTVSEDADAADVYWEWRNANEAHDAPDQSYWYWPTLTKEEQKKQLIQRILEEESLRQQMSTLSIEKNLIKTHHDKPQTERVATVDDSYWQW